MYEQLMMSYRYVILDLHNMYIYTTYVRNHNIIHTQLPLYSTYA